MQEAQAIELRRAGPVLQLLQGKWTLPILAAIRDRPVRLCELKGSPQETPGPTTASLEKVPMTPEEPDCDERNHWESVHVCPNCGQIINLAELDLRAITTGIVTCPSCDWSGQIEIQVIDQVPRKKPTSVE